MNTRSHFDPAAVTLHAADTEVAPGSGDLSAAEGSVPDPAVLAKLANALFAALPGQPAAVGSDLASTPPVTAGAAPGAEPFAPPASAGGRPTEAELRARRAALAGAAGQVPPIGVASPLPVDAGAPLYFLDAAQPASPRTMPALKVEPPGIGLDTFPGLGLRAPSGLGLSVPSAPSAASPAAAPTAIEPRIFLAPRAGATAGSPPGATGEAAGVSFYFLDEARSLVGTAPGVATAVGRPEVLPSAASAHPAFDAHAVRRDFPILAERVNGRPLIWLDNAATTQKPQAVIDRLAYFYRHENSNIHRAAHALAARATDAYEAARDKVARFLHAPSSDEIIFVRGTTEAINLVSQGWGRRYVGADDEIVITWLEHHANIVPWQQLAAEKGARLRVVPVDDHGQVLLDEYEKLLGPRTRIVAFSQVSNALGTITPVHQMVEMAHRHGARVLVDGAQAVSHMRVDVQALDCDWYVFSGHKVFGPTGIGVVYGKLDLLNATPPWQGGGNMIQDVTFERTLYQGAPARFEAGTSNIADAVGLGAALDYLERLGIDNVSRYEHELLAYATRGLSSIPGLRLIGTAPEKAAVLSFVLQGFRTEDVGEALNREGIAVRAGHHCAQPILRRFGLESTVRPSLALYNTFEDIDALVAAMRRIQGGSVALPR